jgi:hypothetical protein
MALTGQLSFEGREVTGDGISLPGIGNGLGYDLPPGEEAAPEHGDRVRVLVEYVIEDVRFPEKHNSEGVAVAPLKRLAVARTIVPETVTITGILRREQIQQAWERDHGAQAG